VEQRKPKLGLHYRLFAMYKIWCIIIDERTPFSVKIDQTESVDDLKKCIKTEKKPILDAFAADQLTLYKIHVETTKTTYTTIVQDISQDLNNPEKATQLDALDELSEVFGTMGPPKEGIHILVERPAGESIQ